MSRMARVLVLLWALIDTPVVRAQTIGVAIDATAATRVLSALRDPGLTTNEALAIARLPGNQGLIRKAQSYGRPASVDSFARALVAAARHDVAFSDESRFQFDMVRDHAAAIGAALTALTDPAHPVLADVRARIAAFTPPNVAGSVTGYLIVGGTSGGFAFSEPVFYLNLDYFPSARLATTVMEHELFHAVQTLARPADRPAARAAAACLARTPHAADIAALFDSLSAEGTASYVGDVLALPEEAADATTAKERARTARNVGLVERSVTQMELSVHGLATNAAVTPDEVYALGFYGDEVLYALGYVMTRAIDRARGHAGVAALIAEPGAALVTRYAELPRYGKDEATPALHPETIAWGRRVLMCAR